MDEDTMAPAGGARPGYLDGEWARQRMRECNLVVRDLTGPLQRERSVCSRIINGVVPLPIDRCPALAEALRVPVRELLQRAGVDVDAEPASPANDAGTDQVAA